MDFSKIDFKSPRVRNAAIVAVIGIAGAAYWHQGIFVKQGVRLDELEGKRDKAQNELNSILAMKPQLNKLRKDIENGQKELDSLKSIFPDQKEIPKLIREITKVAKASQIYTVKFSPLPDVQKEYYVENRYNLSVAGRYHRLAKFFSFLANLPLLINLSDVSIAATGEAAKLTDLEESTAIDDLPTITASFKLTTFSSKK